MSRFAAAAGAFVFTVASAPVAHATVVKTSPAPGAIVSNAAPITLAWSTDNLTSPASGGQVNIVITRNGTIFWNQLMSCLPGGMHTCPTETTVDAHDLPAGTYEWYVRWWIFGSGPSNGTWDTSASSTFTVVDGPASGPPTPPTPPPPPAPQPQPPPYDPPSTLKPLPPALTLVGSRSLRLSTVGSFAEAWTTIIVDRAATVSLSIALPKTGARLRLSQGSQIGSTVSGRARLVLLRSETGYARLAVRIRLGLAQLARGRSYVAYITATNAVGTKRVAVTLRR